MRHEEKPLRTSGKDLSLKKKKTKENIVPFLLLDVFKSEKMIPGDEI